MQNVFYLYSLGHILLEILSRHFLGGISGPVWVRHISSQVASTRFELATPTAESEARTLTTAPPGPEYKYVLFIIIQYIRNFTVQSTPCVDHC